MHRSSDIFVEERGCTFNKVKSTTSIIYIERRCFVVKRMTMTQCK